MSTNNRAPGSYDRNVEIARLNADWAENLRWKNITRTHAAADVVCLRGSLKRDNTLARRGAEKLWELIQNCAPAASFVNALGATSDGQAVQQVRAGMPVIYLSGTQAAEDVDNSETMYPDQSTYAVDSIPSAVRRINNALERADRIQWKAGKQPGNADYVDYFAPILAAAEAGCAGVLNTYELMTNMIRAGAAGVHFDDRLAGHTDNNVLIPTQEAVQKLIAARLASDVEDAPTLIMALTNANAASLLTSDCDECDQPFVIGERNEEGFYPVGAGIDLAIARGLAYAPYADLVSLETAAPDLDVARKFAAAIRSEYPRQLLAYSCVLSSTSAIKLDQATITKFQRELSALGYQLQFIAMANSDSTQQQCSELAA